MDFAETAGRVCCVASTGPGLCTRRAVDPGTTLGFFVGELVLFDVACEQGVLGMAQTLLVSSRPPWVPSDLWKAFEGPNGVVIDARGIESASKPKVRYTSAEAKADDDHDEILSCSFRNKQALHTLNS